MAVTQQPGGGKLVTSVEGTRDWDSPLLGCCEDIKGALCAYCCLPCTICQISSRAGEFACMAWFVPGGLIALRARIRTLGSIRGSICDDCLKLSFCGACAICQMDRELTAMGL